MMSVDYDNKIIDYDLVGWGEVMEAGECVGVATEEEIDAVYHGATEMDPVNESNMSHGDELEGEVIERLMASGWTVENYCEEDEF